VIVRVDDVEQRLVGKLSHAFLDLPGHRAIDSGVNHQGSSRADDDSAVITRNFAGQECVHTRAKAAGKEFHFSGSRLGPW